MRFNQALCARVVVMVVASANACSAATGADDAVHATAGALKALRQGGYVLVLSHGQTESNEVDSETRSLDDCAWQRSLTDTGRLMASGLGKLLAREHVRVGTILSSRYCLAVETAERIAERTHTRTLRKLDALSEGGAAASPTESMRPEALRHLVGIAPAPGTNTIIVTHPVNIAEAFGAAVASVGEGELAIFRPAADVTGQRYRLAYRLKVEDLSAYAKASGRMSNTGGL